MMNNKLETVDGIMRTDVRSISNPINLGITGITVGQCPAPLYGKESYVLLCLWQPKESGTSFKLELSLDLETAKLLISKMQERIKYLELYPSIYEVEKEKDQNA